LKDQHEAEVTMMSQMATTDGDDIDHLRYDQLYRRHDSSCQ